MSEFYQPARQLPAGPSYMDDGYDRQGSGNISAGHVLGVLRRRYKLVLALTLLGMAAGAYLASKTPPSYRAVATIRLAGERRALTGHIESPTPELGRSADPMLSLTQLVRSYSVMG